MYFAFGPRGILDWEVFGKSLHVFGILDWEVYCSEESSAARGKSSSDGGKSETGSHNATISAFLCRTSGVSNYSILSFFKRIYCRFELCRQPVSAANASNVNSVLN